MATISAPFYPIIYVRGFAMTRGEIEATTATPYMGFNQGGDQGPPALGRKNNPALL